MDLRLNTSWQIYLRNCKPCGGQAMDFQDPLFWRAGAVSTTLVMLIVLAFLTIDSYSYMRAGGINVPHYDVINKKIGYEYDWSRSADVPVIGEEELLFGERVSREDAAQNYAQGQARYSKSQLPELPHVFWKWCLLCAGPHKIVVGSRLGTNLDTNDRKGHQGRSNGGIPYASRQIPNLAAPHAQFENHRRRS